MNLSPDWRKAFPMEETRKVVVFICTTWDSLVARRMPKFQPSDPEAHLTQFLKQVLQRQKDSAGLTGNFTSEQVEADPNLVTGTLDNRRRTDIRYFSDRKKIDLTFEFKKLKSQPESRRLYYKEGILRFVDGKYSRDKHLAFMVGLIAESRAKNIDSLKRAITKPDIAAVLHMRRNGTGELIRQPSATLPGHVEFDTEHSRTKLGDQPDILLCHFFLDHPANKVK